MEFKEAIEKIQAGLSGNNEADIAYLKGAMKEYASHPEKERIHREIGKMIYDRLDEKQKEAYGNSIDQDTKQMRATLKEVNYYLKKSELNRALSIIRPLVKTIEKDNLFHSDSYQDYFSFNEPFEQALYLYLEKPTKQVSNAPIPYSDVYYTYACVWDAKNDEKACLEALEKALRWNPMSAKIHFLYMDKMKDLEKYFAYTKFAFQYMFHPSDLSKLYLNLARYYEKKRMFGYQYGCLGLSLQFADDASVVDQMNAIKDRPATLEELKKVIPIGANETVVGLAYGYGKTCLEKQQKEEATYYLQIAYDLSHAKEIEALLKNEN